jgi:hypothetical protein
MGYNLYLGYHPQSDGSFTFGPSLDLLSILDDKQRDDTGTQLALGFVAADPRRAGFLILRRLGYFFNLEWRAFIYFYGNGLFGGLAPAALIGILVLLGAPLMVLTASAAFGAAALRRTPQTVLLLLLVVTYLTPHILILSEERFHLTLIPIAAILAAAAWLRAGSAPRVLSSRTWPAILAVVLLAVNWFFQVVGGLPVLTRLLGPGGSQLHLPY